MEDAAKAAARPHVVINRNTWDVSHMAGDAGGSGRVVLAQHPRIGVEVHLLRLATKAIPCLLSS